MITRPRKTPVTLAAAVLAVLALSLSACVHVHPVGKMSQTVDITIHQDELNQDLGQENFHTDDGPCNLLEKVTRIELHDGYIRFFGTKDLSDGTEVSGSYDLNLSAEDNALKAEITAVDFPGVDLEDKCIVDANLEMEAEFTHMVSDSHGEVLFKEVTVEEGVLKMKIQVNIDF